MAVYKRLTISIIKSPGEEEEKEVQVLSSSPHLAEIGQIVVFGAAWWDLP